MNEISSAGWDGSYNERLRELGDIPLELLALETLLGVAVRGGVLLQQHSVFGAVFEAVAAREEVGGAVTVDALVDEVVEQVILPGGDVATGIYFGGSVDAVAHEEGVEVAGDTHDGAGEFLWGMLDGGGGLGEGVRRWYGFIEHWLGGWVLEPLADLKEGVLDGPCEGRNGVWGQAIAREDWGDKEAAAKDSVDRGGFHCHKA